MDITHHLPNPAIWILHTIWPKSQSKTWILHTMWPKSHLSHGYYTPCDKSPPMNDVTHEHGFFSHESILHTIMRFCSKLKKTRRGIPLVAPDARKLAGPLTGCNWCRCICPLHNFAVKPFLFQTSFTMLPQNGRMLNPTSLHTMSTRNHTITSQSIAFSLHKHLSN
jgi:hypothetical protein